MITRFTSRAIFWLLIGSDKNYTQTVSVSAFLSENIFMCVCDDGLKPKVVIHKNYAIPSYYNIRYLFKNGKT